MRAKWSWWTRLGVIATLVGMTNGFGAAPTWADPVPDYHFSVDIDGSVATESLVGDGVYTGDTDATVHVTLNNTSVTQTLGSANVTVPAPLAVAAVDGVPYGGGPVLELRGLALAAGASRSYTLTVSVQTCLAAVLPAAFAVAAKPTGDYSGSDDFTLLGESSDQQIDLIGVCQLAFVGQPASAERTKTITTVPFTPSGAPITVELRDAGDTGRASAASAVITLWAARPGVDPAPGLAGTTVAATAAGLATFASGPTLSVSASKYSFTASSPGLTSSEASSLFNIVDARAGCPAGGSCSASSSKSGSSVTASVAGGASAGELLLSLGAADAPPFECADYPRLGGEVVSEFHFSTNDRIVTLTYVITNGRRPLKDNLVCWAAPYPFMTAKHTTATVQGVKPGTTDPLYVGVLPFCSNKNPELPCILKRTMDPNTKAITLSVLATSADPWRYN